MTASAMSTTSATRSRRSSLASSILADGYSASSSAGGRRVGQVERREAVVGADDVGVDRAAAGRRRHAALLRAVRGARPGRRPRSRRSRPGRPPARSAARRSTRRAGSRRRRGRWAASSAPCTSTVARYDGSWSSSPASSRPSASSSPTVRPCCVYGCHRIGGGLRLAVEERLLHLGALGEERRGRQGEAGVLLVGRARRWPARSPAGRRPGSHGSRGKPTEPRILLPAGGQRSAGRRRF